jgi:hypothetical protein
MMMKFVLIKRKFVNIAFNPHYAIEKKEISNRFSFYELQIISKIKKG